MSTIINNKIARICWNNEGWIKPSGKNGKSKNAKSYESQTGYGHEEWLLDISKLINGYHYGYLQAIRQHRSSYSGESYSVSLYSINNNTRERWFIGTIHELEVIKKEESKSIFKIYKNNGWYTEMKNQLKNIDADVDEFSSILPENFAIVKFKPENLELLESPYIFDRKYVKSDYYNLKNWEFTLADIFPKTKFNFESGHKELKSNRVISYQNKDSKVIDIQHGKIQMAIHSELSKLYGKQNVGTENKIGNGCRVDIVVKNYDNSFTLYEVKTGYSALICIREAFGQIMEYAHFYDDIKIEKLIIVSPNFPTEDTKNYISKLRDKYKIPIYYQRFDYNKNKLDELY